jgi:FG-GAP repeat
VQTLDDVGNQLTSFYVLDPSIGPGSSIAAGDLDGDGKAEIVFGGGPTTSPWPPTVNGPDQRVAVYEPDGTEVGAFTAYPACSRAVCASRSRISLIRVVRRS